MIEAIDALRQTFFATSPGSAHSCGIRWMEHAVGVPAPAEAIRRVGQTPGRDAGLVRKEVEDVAQHAAVGTIDLRVLASRACHRRELLRLYVEDFGEKAARGSKLTHVARLVTTLGAFELETVH